MRDELVYLAIFKDYSSGLDQVSNQMIKLLPPLYIECLVNCFNVWLKECRYPDFWKTAKIITLNKLKAGVPQCSQTRPISLLAISLEIIRKNTIGQSKVMG